MYLQTKYIRTTSQTSSSQISVVSLNATDTGKVECRAVNSQGSGSSAKFFAITDDKVSLRLNKILTDENNDISSIQTPFQTYGFAGDKKIGAGDTKIVVGNNVTLICEATAYNYLNLSWFLNDDVIKDNDSMTDFLSKR